MGSFLQTEEWRKFQESVGHKTWRFDDGKISANIIRHDVPFGFNYLYIPHGPAIDFNAIQGSIDHELQGFVSFIKNLAREQKSLFIKMEPLDGKVPETLHKFGFKHSKKGLQPHRTVVMDLEKSEEELLAAMHHKTRYNIKVAEKHNITIQPNTDIDSFVKVLKKTAERQKFHTHPASYYKKLFEFFKDDKTVKADLVFADYESKHIAGGLFITYGEMCHYLHGGSDHEYRNLMAPYALHWEAMKYLKKQGIKKYDFGGSEGDKYPGVTKFKLNWGGRQVEYPGSFDLSVRGFWYLMYKIKNKIF